MTTFGSFIASAVSFVVYIVSRFVKVIALILIGAIAIFIGAMIIAGHFGLPYLPMITPDPVISGYIGFYAGLIALVLIPLAFLIKTAINLVWGYRTSWRFRQAVTGVWIVSFMIFLLTVVFTARNFVYETSQTELLTEETLDKQHPLNINIANAINHDDIKINLGHSFLSHGQLYNHDGVAIRFIPVENDQFTISRTSISRGMNQESALRNMNYPSHNISYANNKLSIDEYYLLNNKAKFRVQLYRYEVAVPIGTKLTVNQSSRIFRDRALRNNHDSKEHLWVMTKEGLMISNKEEPS